MSDRKENQREMRRLFSLARDVGLDDDERIQLQELLESDPSLRRQYVQLATTESQLEQLHSRPLLPGDEAGSADPYGSLASSVRASDTVSTTSRKATIRGDVKMASVPDELLHGRSFSDRMLSATPMRWLAACAALLLVAGITVVFAFRGDSSATVVAVDMGGTDQCKYSVGDTLGSRWMTLDSGVVQLSFSSSAMVAVHGPAKFRCLGANRAELSWGGVTVHVPDAASGFTVETEGIDVEDLGTGFSLKRKQDGELTLHVTEGSVRLRDTRRDEQVTASAGQIVVANTQDDGVTRFQRVKAAAKSPVVRGQVVFAKQHPRSLGFDMFDHDHRAFVFLESTNRTLPFDLPVNITVPGVYEKFSKTADVVGEGTNIDCYLVHSAPRSAFHQTRGSVTFPGEILGVITDHDRLNATNEILGANWTLRCHYIHRGLETIPFESADVVTLSDDRRTLSFTLQNSAIDQLRILVKAD